MRQYLRSLVKVLLRSKKHVYFFSSGPLRRDVIQMHKLCSRSVIGCPSTDGLSSLLWPCWLPGNVIHAQSRNAARYCWVITEADAATARL